MIPVRVARVSIFKYRKNLSYFVEALQKQGRHVIVMTPNQLRWTEDLKGLYGESPYDPESEMGFTAQLEEYVRAVREIAFEQSVDIVDVYSAYDKWQTVHRESCAALLLDGIHPNTAGHTIVTKRVNGLIDTQRFYHFMKKYLAGLFAVFAFGSIQTAAVAGLELTVNSTTQQFWFSGSTTGTGTSSDPNESILEWNTGVLTGGASSTAIESAFTTSNGEVEPINLVYYANGGLDLTFYVAFVFPGTPITITADDSFKFSYSSTSAMGISVGALRGERHSDTPNQGSWCRPDQYERGARAFHLCYVGSRNNDTSSGQESSP